MYNILILDDSIERHIVFDKRLRNLYPKAYLTHVKDYNGCIEALGLNNFDLIYLDHDLNDFRCDEVYGKVEMTGTEVTAWMVQNLKFKESKIIIHSWNPYGATRMYQKLIENGFNAIREPFSFDE